MTVGFNFNNGKEILRRHDARSQGTQYGNVLRTLRRSTSRVANEGQSIADRACRADRFKATNRFELGNRNSDPVLRYIAGFGRSAQNNGSQLNAKRLGIKNSENLANSCLTISLMLAIMDSVKSDGVRPKFSTARGGAAFLRKFATSSRAFLLPFPKLNPIPGGRI